MLSVGSFQPHFFAPPPQFTLSLADPDAVWHPHVLQFGRPLPPPPHGVPAGFLSVSVQQAGTERNLTDAEGDSAMGNTALAPSEGSDKPKVRVVVEGVTTFTAFSLESSSSIASAASAAIFFCFALFEETAKA